MMSAVGTRTLREFLDCEFLPSKLGLALQSRKLWATVVNRIGPSLPLVRLTDELVLRHLTDFLAAPHSAVTTNNQRRRLLQLWNSAAEAGYCDPPHGRIPKVKEAESEPEAWTVQEFARILAECRRLKPVPRLPWRALWWESLWTVCYWTGARIGSLLAATLEDWDGIRHELRLWAAAQKDRRGQRWRLPTEASNLLACGLCAAPSRRLLWPWPFHRTWLFRQARKIVTAAEVPCPKGESRQLFHRARRTCLSYCWRVDPGIAQRQAGHSSPVLTERHYIDMRIAGTRTAADVLPAIG
jgi:integrase